MPANYRSKPGGLRYACGMRVLLVVLLAGCIERSTVPPDDPGPGNGGNGEIFPGGIPSGRCQGDSACNSGEVCARSGNCLPASQVFPVHVAWTLRGMPAGPMTCEAAQDLEIGFFTASGDGYLGYAPVPCVEGKFTIDKLPRTYVRVRLGRTHAASEGQAAVIDGTTGDATVDLPF
jgi:hypothetical protein